MGGHVTPQLERLGIPTVMVATDTFSEFGRRMAASKGVLTQ